MPADGQMRVILSEDWSRAECRFVAKAETQLQAVAAELLSEALARYVRAYGVEIAGRRLKNLLDVLRANARSALAQRRMLEARADINARARIQYERGDIEAARAIEAEPTPDYTGKNRDEYWLSGGHNNAG